MNNENNRRGIEFEGAKGCNGEAIKTRTLNDFTFR
jgi:hypothetical protein